MDGGAAAGPDDRLRCKQTWRIGPIAGREAAYEVVGSTGIEPVTPTMSR